MEANIENPVKGNTDVQSVLLHYKIPSRSSRFVAYLIDAVIVFWTVFLVDSYFTIFPILWPLLFFCGFIYALYITFLVFLAGKTLGYLVLGLKVIPLQKQRISFGMALLRGSAAASLVTFPFSPFILVGHVVHMIENRKDRLKRTIWDLGSRTVVVKSWR